MEDPKAELAAVVAQIEALQVRLPRPQFFEGPLLFQRVLCVGPTLTFG